MCDEVCNLFFIIKIQESYYQVIIGAWLHWGREQLKNVSDLYLALALQETGNFVIYTIIKTWQRREKTLINASRPHVGTIYVAVSNLKLIPWRWWKIWKVWTTSPGLRTDDCIFIRERQPLSLLGRPVIIGPWDFSADAACPQNKRAPVN
jgi:hypothetical protein